MPNDMSKIVERALLQRELDKRAKAWLTSTSGRAWHNTWANHPDKLNAAKIAMAQSDPELGALISRLED